MVDAMRGGCGAETVIDVDHSDSSGTRVQHPEERGPAAQ
jgi:hypothetical protein